MKDVECDWRMCRHSGRSNFPFEQTAGSPSLAAAAQRERYPEQRKATSPRKIEARGARSCETSSQR
jgi:hypothetical protein